MTPERCPVCSSLLSAGDHTSGERAGMAIIGCPFVPAGQVVGSTRSRRTKYTLATVKLPRRGIAAFEGGRQQSPGVWSEEHQSFTRDGHLPVYGDAGRRAAGFIPGVDRPRKLPPHGGRLIGY